MKKENGKENKEEKYQDIDSLLVKVGDFGRYQRRVVFLVAFVSFSTAFNNLGYVFWGARPSYHCLPPVELEKEALARNITSEELLNISVPWEQENSKSRRSMCKMYNISVNDLENEELFKNLTLFIPGSSQTSKSSEILMVHKKYREQIECNRWHYDTSTYKSTIVTEWDLVCSRQWMISLTQSMYMAGRILGSLIYGHLSDRFGRRKALLIAITLQVITSTSSSFMTSYYPFLVLRFLLGIHTTGEFQCAYVIATEYVGSRWRVLAGTITQLYWAVGYMTVALVAYLIRDRTYLQLTLSLPLIILVAIVYCFVPETPRWLFARGRRRECVEQLNKIAQTNKKQHLDIDVDKLELPVHADTEHYSFINLFKTSGLRRITLLLFYIWFVNSFVFYGLSLGVSTLLSGDPYLNFFLSGLVEIPANLACLVSFTKLGRPLPFCISMLLAGVTLFTVAFLPSDQATLGTSLGLVGKAAITCSYAMVYLFTAEIYPTVVRGIGLSGGTMMARLGAVIAPFAAEMGSFWKPLPMLVFGGFTIVAAVLVLWLPETKDRSLTQTIQEPEKQLASNTTLDMCRFRKKTFKEYAESNGTATTKF